MTSLAVLIAVYNNPTGLSRSLESVDRAQGDFDIVVVDDGSSPPVRLPAETDSRHRLVLLRLDANSGIAAALNHGVRFILSKGFDYIGRLDSGDTVAPERFERQLAFMQSNPDHAVVSSFVDFVDSSHRLLFRFRGPSDHKHILRRMHINSCVMHPGSMLRASALREAGMYSENAQNAEDYELFLRLSKRYKLAVIPEVLTSMEYSPRGISVAGRRTQQAQRLKLQLRYFDPRSPFSFYGVARTLVAMLTPQRIVMRFKQAYLR
jgi:glycosyltransferase involved in cell wall biosynthesis